MQRKSSNGTPVKICVLRAHLKREEKGCGDLLKGSRTLMRTTGQEGDVRHGFAKRTAGQSGGVNCADLGVNDKNK